MQVKSIAECSKGSILQYVRTSLSYHLSLRSLFSFFWVAVLHRFYCTTKVKIQEAILPVAVATSIILAASFVVVHVSPLFTFTPNVLCKMCVMWVLGLVLIVLTGSICSNTDMSELSIVGICDIFVYQTRHKVMWFARLVSSISFIK